MIFFKCIYHFNAVIKKLVYKIIFGSSISFKKGSTFRKRFNVYIEKGGKIYIGKNVFFNNDCSLNCLSEIEIGDNCIFGENVKIYDQNHNFKDNSLLISDQGFSTKKVQIGSNCWIGSNVTILQGVTIGNNSVIGANCLIYKSIPSNYVAKSRTEIILEENRG